MDYLDHATTLKCTEEQGKNSWARSYFCPPERVQFPWRGQTFSKLM